MQYAIAFLKRRANDVMVALMAVMFGSFIVQIATRYIFNVQAAWSFELILDTWLWAVFWGAAFLLRDQDQVKFDIVYNLGNEGIRRVLALVSALFLAVGFLASAPATYDFISFKAIRSSDTLGIRLDILFSVYLIFLVAIILYYLRRAWLLVKGVPMARLERSDAE